MQVLILDIGIGNIKSLLSCLNFLGVNSLVSSKKEDMKISSHIILPGVGSYDSFLLNLKKRNLANEIIFQVKECNKPFLGICAGMQILGNISSEGSEKGLGLIDSDVTNLKNPIGALCQKVPNVGFREIYGFNKIGIFKNILDNAFFYFTHSFAFSKISVNSLNLAYTKHNLPFIAAFQKNNLCGVQFHPEKSQSNGLKILSNFLELK
jgi:glutamine amidotransferase